MLMCCDEALVGRDLRGGTFYALGVNHWPHLLPKHLRKTARAKYFASLKLGDLEAITVWQNELGDWKTPEKKQWAVDMLHTYAINYKKMCQFYVRLQTE